MIQKFSIFRMLGAFGLIIILTIWLGPMLLDVYKSIAKGDYKSAIKLPGSRVFAIDNSIKEETDLLLSQKREGYELVFHLIYTFTLFLMLFTLGYFMFTIFGWMSGRHQLSPLNDILMAIITVLLFGLLEFCYMYFLFNITVIPFKDGIWYFIKSLPTILQNFIV